MSKFCKKKNTMKHYHIVKIQAQALDRVKYFSKIAFAALLYFFNNLNLTQPVFVFFSENWITHT